jgi:hypothetical protein
MGIGLLTLFVKIFIDYRNYRLLKLVTARNRGEHSERDLVLKLLKKGVHPETIFHDLYFETKQGKTSQVDLVLATSEGIIVIEVKDYKGWIFGDANYTNWTKVLAYGKRKYKFFNPIKQNAGHIKSIKSKLPQFENIPFYSLIVFYGACELKEINYVPEGTFIVKSHRIFEVLEKIKKSNPPAPYTNKSEILALLKEASKAGENDVNQKNHIENVNDMVGKHRVYS